MKLASKWKVAIFGCRSSFMGEDNELQFSINTIDNERFHYIPIRSDLLITTWARTPLKAEVLKQFLDPQKEQRVLNFVDAVDGDFVPKTQS